VCVFKFLGYIVWLQSCSFCACFFLALLACLPFFFLLQFLWLWRVSKGIEKGILKLPSEREQKRLNTHHRVFFCFQSVWRNIGLPDIFIFPSWGLFGMDSICSLIKTS
jgi:hypothetical protein